MIIHSRQSYVLQLNNVVVINTTKSSAIPRLMSRLCHSFYRRALSTVRQPFVHYDNLVIGLRDIMTWSRESFEVTLDISFTREKWIACQA